MALDAATLALCAREHPLARRRVVRLRELARWGLAIGNEARWKIFRSIVLSAFSAAAVPVHVAYEADDTPLLLEAIAQSDCVGLFGEEHQQAAQTGRQASRGGDRERDPEVVGRDVDHGADGPELRKGARFSPMRNPGATGAAPC